MPASKDPLDRYRTKRNFGETPEPRGEIAPSDSNLAFVIQKHAATRLHYDFRLELGGVMLSWAVPRGPSYDPREKRMAIQVEDHPISYNSFEGTIPAKQYGAGSVIIWDRGTWEPVSDPHAGLVEGKLLFKLHGQKMAGLWELVRIAKPGDRQIAWILFKKHDDYERPKEAYDVVKALPDSVVARPLGPASRPVRRQHAGESPRSGVTDPSMLPGAIKAPVPARIGPQLATLSTALPLDGDWIFEIKFDGYRLMSRIENGVPRLITRGGHDWTSKMPGLATELAGLDLGSAWLDGELVVLAADGLPDFNALQKALDQRDADRIVYFLFDVPYLQGFDLRQTPLQERRQLLRALLESKTLERIRFSVDFDADPASILQSASNLKLEGVIAKRTDAPYLSQRTQTWLKLKCRQRQEFVVGGFTDRGNDPAASEIGSLMLGVHDGQGQLVSVGGVGTGWDAATAIALKGRVAALETTTSPFAGDGAARQGQWTRRPAGSVRWVRPKLVVEASFAGWTPEGQIRHAVFEGLRADKPSKDVVREDATTPQGAMPLRSAAAANATRVSNPERVIDASTGLTKLDLVRYYESVADWMIPHLKGRPCSLVRGPTGIAGELFFQKHADKLHIPDVKELAPSLWPEHDPLLEVHTAKGLAGAAQMNVIEFHTWNALVKNLDKPDRMVFDLDPGDGVAWLRVLEAASLTRSFLKDLGLDAWLKTSGGKGLHVVVPLAPRHGWPAVKGLSQAIVQHLANVLPDRFVAKSGPKNRVGKIFVDYLRNGFGATTAAAYSARARPGLGVSMPVPWEMLDSLKGGSQWTIATAREHLSFHTSDPWVDYWKTRQTLRRAMKILEFDPPE
ncbi:DNA ligase D [Rivibacter subsaxonicus]|uniref:DNA ligase (ATP) n=1 Tax=Rivibacter subsaxonicus TaxID=457575 RepID=A0A4Q7VN74_9BURK|nr:DNA ligase D [Rivibacter subsaxonicus]RZT97800.1 bifunctional non-homologous end joining protein LigD [Rivibacter subsaxonicus]